MECSSSTSLFKGIAAAAVAGMVACSCFIASPAHAVTAAEKEAEAQEALNQLTAMQTTLEETSAKYYQSLADYQKAVEKRDAAKDRIDEISKEIKEVQGRLSDRARDMYRAGSASFVDLLLGATSFDEFSNNWDLLNRVNETDANLSAKAKALRTETEERKVELDKQTKVAEEKSAEAGKAFQESQTLVAQMEQTYNSLSAEAAKLYEEERIAAEQAAAEAAAAAAAAAAAEEATYYEDEDGDGGEYQAAAYNDDGEQVAVQNDDGTVTDTETGETYTSTAEYSAATGNEVVDRAMSMLGAGYEYGATGTNGTFDCSGLVGYALTGSTERIGNTTSFMEEYEQVSDPQPGDICVSEGHTGIYIGDGQMVHASDESTGVITGDVQSDMIYVRP